MRARVGADAGAAAGAKLNKLLSVFLVVALFAVFGLLCPVAYAQEASAPQQAQRIIEESGLDIAAAAQWSLAALLDKLWETVEDNIAAPLEFARKAAVYMLVACAAGLLASGSWKKCIDVVCLLGFGALSLSAMMKLSAALADTVQTGQAYLVTFVPVYSGIAALGGQGAGAMAYRCMFFTVATFLSGAIGKVLMPVMQIYFCFAASAAVWGNAGIEQAARLFMRGLMLLLKGCCALFSFVLGLQSVLTAATDTAALNIGKNVLGAAVPLVGDAAAAALSSAYSAVHLLKGSLALAAVAALGAAFAPVLVQCVLYGAAFCLAGILANGSGQKQCGQLCQLFAGGARLCASVLTLYFFIVLLATILLLIAGTGG